MGVDFDVGARDLIQQVLQIDQIVTGDQDAGTGLSPTGYGRRFRFAESRDVARIQTVLNAKAAEAAK